MASVNKALRDEIELLELELRRNELRARILASQSALVVNPAAPLVFSPSATSSTPSVLSSPPSSPFPVEGPPSSDSSMSMPPPTTGRRGLPALISGRAVRASPLGITVLPLLQLSTTESASSATSQGGSSSDCNAPPRPRRTRKSQQARLTQHGGYKIGITQRRHWLTLARGNSETTVTHMLELPAFYHRDIDPAPPKPNLQAVPLHWEDKQPTMRQWFGRVLQHRHYKFVQKESTRRKGKRKAGDSDDGDADNEEASESDWEEEFEQAVKMGFSCVDPEQLNPGAAWRIKRPMPDRLYIELIRTLLSPNADSYLTELSQTNDVLAKVIRRQLFEHARYHLFWAHVTVVDPAEPTIKVSRLIPALFRVHSDCMTDSLTLQECQRCLPMSQLPLLLDLKHSGQGHMKDNHATLSKLYCGVPRKAVRLFAAKCTVCTRVDPIRPNARPPRAIVVQDVRQRYTLDLVDMKKWMKGATGAGKDKRYIAHLIDHSSKFRWTVAIKKREGAEIVAVLRQVFTDFGHPALLHTDNGTEFINWEVLAECRRWGTRVIHGRPYHPQSQGVVERVNGVIKSVMKKWAASNPEERDWTFIMSAATSILNNRVSYITRRVPKQHFEQFNRMTRTMQPIPSDEPVLITVDQVPSIDALRWLTPVEMRAFTAHDWDSDDDEKKEVASDEKEAASDAAPGVGRGQSMEDVPLPPPPRVQAEEVKALSALARPGIPQPAAYDSDEGDMDEDAPPSSVAARKASTTPAPQQPRCWPPSLFAKSSSSSLPPASQLKVAPTPTPAEDDLVILEQPDSAPFSMQLRSRALSATMDTSRMSILAPGVRGNFEVEEWDGYTGPQVRLHMRRIGTIANGDCGPAAAYFALHGRTATEEQAAELRDSVYKFSHTTEGQAYWADYLLHEQQQLPEELPVYQRMWARPREWVTIDFMTMFGGWAGLNVWVLRQGLDASGKRSCAVCLVTYGRHLIKEDSANTCCVYFQVKYGSLSGHFEAVVDAKGRHRWQADDPTVKEVLLHAFEYSNLSVVAEDMRLKSLKAEMKRTDAKNEKLEVGDLAWLFLEDAVIKRAIKQMEKDKRRIPAEPERKILVKIAEVKDEPAKPGVSPLPTQMFTVMTHWGRIREPYSIDQLQRCNPPPEQAMYPTVGLLLPGPGQLRKKKGLAQTSVYKLHCEQLMQLTTAQKITPREVEHAVQIANDLSAALKAAQSTPSPATAADAEQAAEVAAAAAAERAAAAKDEELLPCTHCGVVEPRKSFTSCMLDSCCNVFHYPGTGCAHGEKVQRVNELLLYCRPTCAARDTNASDSVRGKSRVRSRGRGGAAGGRGRKRQRAAVLHD